MDGGWLAVSAYGHWALPVLQGCSGDHSAHDAMCAVRCIKTPSELLNSCYTAVAF